MMRYKGILSIVAVAVGLIAVACTSGGEEPAPPNPTAVPPEAAVSSEPSSADFEQATAQEDGIDGAKSEEPATVQDVVLLDDKVPPFLTFGWDTDFSRHSVPYTEIQSGGPGRDGIPPIDNPKYIDVATPPDYMTDADPVISLEINGDARAYPLAILISHEIVNDEVGGVPVSVTYCPLRNTAIVLDRRVNGRVLDFGTSGNLRNSDLVMWDRQTQSWWQQITGEAIVGELTGTKLTFIPAPVVSWGDFREAFPEGKLLSRDTGFRRTYDSPPYSGYDDPDRVPFLFSGQVDPRLKPMERVVAITVGDQDVAYPFSVLVEHPVVNDTIEGQDIVIFYAGGTLSPFLGRGFSGNRPVGATAVYEPFVDGQELTFVVENDIIVDRETGSKWNILGMAVEGPLAGEELTPFLHGNHFWFAWAAFNPETSVRTVGEVAG